MKKNTLANYLAITIILTTTIYAAPASALNCEAGFRPFKHAMGEDCIPTQPKRIATTNGDKIATPLLDLGAPVVASGFRHDSQEKEFLRGAIDIFGKEFVEKANITSIGNSSDPDLEAIVALAPDLIILPGWRSNLYSAMNRIAPTVVVPQNTPYFKHLETIADAAGMSNTYQDRLNDYETKIEKIRNQIKDPLKISISRFNMFQNTLGYSPNWGAMDQVISDIGFSRPKFQSEATKTVLLSLEEINSFDADIILVSYAPRFGQTIEAYKNYWDNAIPFWRNLQGVQSGNLYWYERDIWAGYTFKSLDIVAESLLLLSAGRFD